jgi:hypothetical protein
VSVAAASERSSSISQMPQLSETMWMPRAAWVRRIASSTAAIVSSLGAT